MLRTVALSLTAASVAVVAQDCPSIKDIDVCKNSKGCKWSKGLAVCFVKADGPPADSPEPTLPPTEPPTDMPTGAPTDAPTDMPTAISTEAPISPVIMPTEPPSEPSEGPIACVEILGKSTCNNTPTCLFQNINQVCVGCPSIESKTSCREVEGCIWRNQECRYGSEDPAHPNDEDCAVHMTKRHCRRMEGCAWNRNGKCKGNQGCSSQKNSIDCRAANQCFWLPNQNECIDFEEP